MCFQRLWQKAFQFACKFGELLAKLQSVIKNLQKAIGEPFASGKYILEGRLQMLQKAIREPFANGKNILESRLQTTKFQ